MVKIVSLYNYLPYIKMSLEILKKYKIKAKKWLWQNFLVNWNAIEEIANTIEVEWKNIIEVWPWYWALTEVLIEENPKSLNLIELDQDMIDILNDRISNNDLKIENIDFNITKKDILKYEPEIKKYSVIANIPYYITSPILRHFLYNVKNSPEDMVILMQKEVAEKIMLNFKNKSSVISLMVEKKSDVSYVLDVPKSFFVPEPKIDSAVLLFNYNNKFEDINDGIFLKIIKIWFAASRKMLIKNFTNAWYEKDYIIQVFDNLWINLKVRWEDLDIFKWCELIREFNT